MDKALNREYQAAALKIAEDEDIARAHLDDRSDVRLLIGVLVMQFQLLR